MDNDLAEFLLLFDDDYEVVRLAAQHHLNGLALLLDDENTSKHAPWVKIFVDVDGWMELDDPQFRVHFRMTRPVFNKLVTSTENHLRQQGRLKRIRNDFELPLMMALWVIMNMDTFKNTALHFFTTPGVVLYHYLYIIEALREMGPEYIKWRSQEERNIIKHSFEEKYGYPGVVGVIDRTHSYVTAPLVEPHAYINRHHTYSILTQTVVDYYLIVRDLYVGESGSLHDSRVFRRSPLSTNLLENQELLGEDEHIIGDGAYILTDKLLIPYDDNGALTQLQRNHNEMLSACRQCVERSYCFVKQKFPRLKYFRSLRVEYAVDHITSCFVLHIFFGLEGEKYQLMEPGANIGNAQPAPVVPAIELEDRGFGNFANINIEPDHPLLVEARINGEDKRERIAAMLFEGRNI